MPVSLIRSCVFHGQRTWAVIVAVSLCACAGADRESSELSQRIEQNGYSFMPPPEPRWFIADRSSDRITLARVGRVEGETYLIEGSHITLDALEDPARLTTYVSNMQQRELPRPRFRIREHEVSELRLAGARCAMSHIVAEDRDPGTGSNVVTGLLIESVGTICIHPANVKTGISLAYTHGSFPEDRDRGFEAVATQLLQTQSFEDFQSPIND